MQLYRISHAERCRVRAARADSRPDCWCAAHGQVPTQHGPVSAQAAVATLADNTRLSSTVASQCVSQVFSNQQPRLQICLLTTCDVLQYTQHISAHACAAKQLVLNPHPVHLSCTCAGTQHGVQAAAGSRGQGCGVQCHQLGAVSRTGAGEEGLRGLLPQLPGGNCNCYRASCSVPVHAHGSCTATLGTSHNSDTVIVAGSCMTMLSGALGLLRSCLTRCVHGKHACDAQLQKHQLISMKFLTTVLKPAALLHVCCPADA